MKLKAIAFVATADYPQQLIQYVDIAALPALSSCNSTAVVLSGTNVYTFADVDGTNDPISASLLGNLISRVQSLCKHH